MPSREIATARTILHPVATADLDALHRLWTEGGVRRYLWDDEIVPRETTAAAIERSVRQFADQGHGLWLARSRDGDELVGFSGFWYFHEPPRLEILYGVDERYWGRGLACEIAAAVIRHGFEVLGMTRIEGSTDFPNAASMGVMEKIGMRRVRRERAEGRDTVFFAVERPLPEGPTSRRA